MAVLGLVLEALQATDPAGVRVMFEPEAPVDANLIRETPARLAKLVGCREPACSVTARQHGAHVMLAHVAPGSDPHSIERMRARLASIDDVLEPNNVRAQSKPVVVERGPRPRMPAHVGIPPRGLAPAARGALVGPRREEVPHALDRVERAPRHNDGRGDTAMPAAALGPVALDAPAVDAALSSQSDRAKPEHERPRERAVRARAEARALLK